MQTMRKTTGSKGELIARTYLTQHGLHILESNWHCTSGEIDIVAQHDNVIHFIEVRTRHTEDVSLPLESIGIRKQTRMLNAAQTYIDTHELGDIEWQIDVVAIALPYHDSPIIAWVENALDW